MDEAGRVGVAGELQPDLVSWHRVSRADHTTAPAAGPDKLAANRKFSATTAGSQTFFKCHNFPPPLLSDADIASITKCHHRGNQCIDCQIQMSETSVSRKEVGPPHTLVRPHTGDNNLVKRGAIPRLFDPRLAADNHFGLEPPRSNRFTGLLPYIPQENRHCTKLASLQNTYKMIFHGHSSPISSRAGFLHP